MSVGKSAAVDEPKDEPAPVDEPKGQLAAVDEPLDKLATVFGPTDETAAVEAAACVGSLPMAAPAMTRRSSKWGMVALAVLVILGLFHFGKVVGFVAYNCVNATNQVNVYSAAT